MAPTLIVRKTVVSVVLACLSAVSVAQEFKPHPRAGITAEQWQAYFDEVSARHGNDAQDIESEKLMVFFDRTSGTSYAFTKPGHAAHPAWVTRQVRERDGKVGVAQIGYFAGREDEFAKLFRAYQQLNERMRDSFTNRGSSAAPAAPASVPR